MSMSTDRPDTSAATNGSDHGDSLSTPLHIRHSHSRGFSAGFVVKLVLMALVNAFGLFGILSA